MSDTERLEYFMTRVFEAEEVWYLSSGKEFSPAKLMVNTIFHSGPIKYSQLKPHWIIGTTAHRPPAR